MHAWSGLATNAKDWDGIKNAWQFELDGVSTNSIAYALKHLTDDLPPTAKKFRRLCDEGMGVVNEIEAFEEVLQNKFPNRAAEIAWDKILNWDKAHDKKNDLLKKFTFHYREAVILMKTGILDIPALESFVRDFDATPLSSGLLTSDRSTTSQNGSAIAIQDDSFKSYLIKEVEIEISEEKIDEVKNEADLKEHARNEKEERYKKIDAERKKTADDYIIRTKAGDMREYICNYYGCQKIGRFNATTIGRGAWYCRHHFRN